jgi:uncharacterized protein YcbX
MLRLTQINIYPVKSLDGFSPQQATVESRGLQYDRRWMLVDEAGKFMSQRTTRKMTHLRAQIEGDNLVILDKNNPTHRVSVAIAAEGELIAVTVWDDTTEGMKISAEADVFLHDFLGVKCHLVKMPDTAKRLVEEKYNTGDDVVSYADGFPFLIIGEASINDLNERLETPLNVDNQPLVGMRRFRTNFVFSGGTPYEEDDWTSFRIGNVAFFGCKPCGRCVMTTLDPDTGEGDKEPLKTLATYRNEGKRIKFGQNVIWNDAPWKQDHAPEVEVGDIINAKI